MVVAMMLLMIADSAAGVAARSLWRRRHWAIAEFVAGYLAVWTLAGLALVPLGVFVPSIVALALAAGWRLTQMRQRAMVRGHGIAPLAPAGWRAWRDCVAYGVSTGGYCFANCWALMLACTASGHSLTVMAGLCAMSIAERNQRRPDQRVFAAAVLALGLGSWLMPS